MISFDAVVPLTVKDESIEVVAKIVWGLLYCACHSADSFGRLGLPRAKATCLGSLGGSPSRLEDAVLVHVDMWTLDIHRIFKKHQKDHGKSWTDFCTPEGLRNQHHEHHFFLCVDLPIHAAWNGTTVFGIFRHFQVYQSLKGSFAVASNSYFQSQFLSFSWCKGLALTHFDTKTLRSLAVSDCWDKGSQKALCAADISAPCMHFLYFSVQNCKSSSLECCASLPCYRCQTFFVDLRTWWRQWRMVLLQELQPHPTLRLQSSKAIPCRQGFSVHWISYVCGDRWCTKSQSVDPCC